MPNRVYLPSKVCPQCQTIFSRRTLASGKEESASDYRERHFCGHDCSHAWHMGHNHPLFKPEGSVRYDGYVRIAVNGKRVYLHRYLMEQHLGRPLKRTEHVHHIDENPQNNVIENLELLTDSEHLAKHYTSREINAKGQFI